jgi:uncharacterized protein
MQPLNLNLITATLRRHLPPLAQRYQVASFGVFGSYARNEQDQDSDVDILVTFTEPPGLLRYIELENYLSDLLGIPVDLVMQEALRPALREQVQNEIVVI